MLILYLKVYYFLNFLFSNYTTHGFFMFQVFFFSYENSKNKNLNFTYRYNIQILNFHDCVCVYLRCFDWIFITLLDSLVIPAFTVERFCKGDGEPGALVSQRRQLCMTNVPLMCLIKAHWTVVPVAFDSGRITRDHNRIRCPHSVCLIIHNKTPQGIKVNRASIFLCRLTRIFFYYYHNSHKNNFFDWV